MQKNKLLRVILVGISLNFACSSPPTIPVSLILTDTLEIPLKIDIDATHRLNAKYYNWDNKNYICAYADIDMSLHIFDLDSKTETETIDLSNLPNEKRVRAFKFLNENTILLSTQLTNQYYFVNRKGELMSSFKLEEPGFEKNDNFAFGNFNDGVTAIPILFLENKYITLYQTYFATFPFLKKHSMFYVFELNSTDSLNLNDHKKLTFFEFNDTSYPLTGQYNPNMCEVNGSILMSSYNKANLLIINPATGEKEEIKSPESAYLGAQTPIDTLRLNDSEYVITHSFYNSGYRSIHYDPYRKLIYRFVGLPIEDSLEFTSTFINVGGLKPFSIMIYDSSFNFINEIKFPANTYCQDNLIVTPDGILLDVANKGNIDYKTGALTYHLFKVVQ